jgi:DNA-binding Lrp family transcriptional regulator
MSKTILAQVDGWTPVTDTMIQDMGLMTATVFGKAWRYCQMSDGVCKASQDRLADELGISRATINTHLAKLTEAGYLKDLTPDLLGLPHQYADTGKANLSIFLTATCQKDLHLPVKKIDTKKEVKETNKENKPKADKPPTPPEVKLFREVTEKYPNKVNFENVTLIIQGVSKRLKRDCSAEDLRPFYAAWCANGWNPTNLAWLAYAERGEIPTAQKGKTTYGTNQASSQSVPTESDREIAASIKAQRVAASV